LAFDLVITTCFTASADSCQAKPREFRLKNPQTQQISESAYVRGSHYDNINFGYLAW